jgi:hypothetical protein
MHRSNVVQMNVYFPKFYMDCFHILLVSMSIMICAQLCLIIWQIVII